MNNQNPTITPELYYSALEERNQALEENKRLERLKSVLVMMNRKERKELESVSEELEQAREEIRELERRNRTQALTIRNTKGELANAYEALDQLQRTISELCSTYATQGARGINLRLLNLLRNFPVIPSKYRRAVKVARGARLARQAEGV